MSTLVPGDAGSGDRVFCPPERKVLDAANEALLRQVGVKAEYYVLRTAVERQPPGTVGGDAVYDVPVLIEEGPIPDFFGDPHEETNAWNFEGPFPLRILLSEPFTDPFEADERGGSVSFEGLAHIPIKEFRDKVVGRVEPVEGDVLVIKSMLEPAFDIALVERAAFFGTEFTAVDVSLIHNQKFVPERRLGVDPIEPE